RYEIREKSFSDGDQHKVYEGGELTLYSQIEESALRNDMVFIDPEDETTKLTVTSNPKLDVPVSYSIIDEEEDEVIGGLRRDWGFIRHRWKLIDGDNQTVGAIKEDYLSLSLIRRFITTLLPFKYDVVSTEGEKIADIDGELKYRDIYHINICGDVDPRLLVSAALVIDSIEKK
ncbi:MAG: hypothetical protein ABEK04_02165, partial [Candidatus Nanohalobium sp.]